MRIREIRERTVPISRYQDPAIPSGGLRDGATLVHGAATPPDAPGIGVEAKAGLMALIRESFAN